MGNKSTGRKKYDGGGGIVSNFSRTFFFFLEIPCEFV